MSRCKLSSTFVSEDEARRNAHKELQEENSWRLSYLQTAYRPLLLSCKTLQREQVSGAFLSEHQTEASTTKSRAKVKFSNLALKLLS